MQLCSLQNYFFNHQMKRLFSLFDYLHVQEDEEDLLSKQTASLVHSSLLDQILPHQVFPFLIFYDFLRLRFPRLPTSLRNQSKPKPQKHHKLMMLPRFHSQCLKSTNCPIRSSVRGTKKRKKQRRSPHQKFEKMMTGTNHLPKLNLSSSDEENRKKAKGTPKGITLHFHQ